MNQRKPLFGTDGLRALADAPPLSAPRVEALGRALAAALAPSGGKAAVCRDTRASGPEILRALAAGVTASGVDLIDAGVRGTPAMPYLARAFGCAFSAVISASHNPAEYNGIKVFGANGEKISRSIEESIESGIEAPPGPARTRGAISEPPPGDDPYLSALAILAGGAGGLEGLSIVLDAANGAAFLDGPEILARLGARVVPISVQPDGTNINRDCGALHPEKAAVKALEEGAFGGMALDGDADRVIFADEKGSVRDGDFALASLAPFMASKGLLPGRTVVGTVMTNVGLEIFLRERGIELIRTDVGDRNVAEAMRDGGFALGGEPSGHLIFASGSDLLPGDGLLAGIRLFSAAKETGRPLSALAEGFVQFPQVIVNVAVSSKPPFDEIPGFGAAIERAREAVGPGGRIVLRYSGTEPKARVMMEGRDEAVVREEALALGRRIKEHAGA